MNDSIQKTIGNVIRAQAIIDKAQLAGCVIDAGNVVDLLADNLTDLPILECRVIARKLGYGVRS